MHLLTYLPLRCTDLYNDTSQLLFLVYFKSVVMEFRTKPHSFCWSTRIQLNIASFVETSVCILIQRHLPPHFLQHPLKQWAHDISLKDPVSLKKWNAPHTVFSAWKWNNTIIKTVICYHKDVKAKKKYSKDSRTIMTRNVCYFIGTGLRALMDWFLQYFTKFCYLFKIIISLLW